MPTETQYLRIVRASAWYDLVVTAPFMTSWTFLIVMQMLGGFHEVLGLPGNLTMPGTQEVLFANLLGSVVVVWALVRLHLNLPILGRYDAAARLLFSIWQVQALISGMSGLLIVFIAFEIGFGVAQLVPYRRDSELEARANS